MNAHLDVRRRNAVYVVIWILYYAWVIVFSTWWTALPNTALPFDTQMRSIIHGTNLLASALFVLIVRREWFVTMARVGAICILVSLLMYFMVSDSTLRLVAALALATSIGCVNIAILMPFVFSMDDGERLLSVAGSNVLIYLLLVAQDVLALGDTTMTVLSFALLLVALGCVPFFRRGDTVCDDDACDMTGRDGAAHDKTVDKAKRARVGRGAWVALVLSCVFALLGRGVTKGLLDTLTVSDTGYSLHVFIVASAIGAVLFYFFCRFGKSAPHHVWNVTFGLLAVAFIFYAFVDRVSALLPVFAVSAGLGNTMGMCSMYYLLGLIGNRSGSMRYVRLSILLIGACGGISGIVVGNLIAGQRFPGLTLTVAILSSVAVLAFLTASSALPRFETELPSRGVAQEKTADTFARYGLSKRESEVCELLLQGYTMRQIAGILSIAYPTVNTYCTTLYRKTGVNSRTELMLLFREHLHD